ncbi:hypothetical protein JD969_01670 [Planctomycetota bacterium]|nr:hypothetical protein JD969_01670 [Planctomycetota bacterium]
MRRFRFFQLTLLTLIAMTTLSLASNVYAGFMFELDYINQGKGALYEEVEGGRWQYDNVHFYWRDDAPDLNALMNSNSIRCSLWKTDSNGDPTKHYISMVGDVKDYLEDSFMSDIARMNVLRDTKHGLYANLDFYESAGVIKTIDEKFESLFETVFKQDGKGALGWTGNMLFSGIYKLVSKFTPLDELAPILDPIFGSPSLTAYIPEYDALYDDYDITTGPTSIHLPDIASLSPISVPEPATASLIFLGLTTILVRPKRTN